MFADTYQRLVVTYFVNYFHIPISTVVSGVKQRVVFHFKHL